MAKGTLIWDAAFSEEVGKSCCRFYLIQYFRFYLIHCCRLYLIHYCRFYLIHCCRFYLIHCCRFYLIHCCQFYLVHCCRFYLIHCCRFYLINCCRFYLIRCCRFYLIHCCRFYLIHCCQFVLIHCCESLFTIIDTFSLFITIQIIFSWTLGSMEECCRELVLIWSGTQAVWVSWRRHVGRVRQSSQLALSAEHRSWFELRALNISRKDGLPWVYTIQCCVSVDNIQSWTPGKNPKKTGDICIRHINA